MTLETKLKALELSMHGKASEISNEIIAVEGVQDLLTTHFAEQEARPELTSSFRPQTLLYEYLQLDLEEREELEQFRIKNTKYMKGISTKNEKEDLAVNSRNVEKLVRKLRLTNQLTTMFEFYLQNRNDFEEFTISSFRNNPLFKTKFGKLGKSLDNFFRRKFKQEGGFDYFVGLIAEERSEIKGYTDLKEVLKRDGARKLTEMFDFYLENRGDFQVFNINTENPLFKAKFGNLGNSLTKRFQGNFGELGGTDYLMNLVAEQRPEIKRYMDPKEIYKMDGIRMLTEVFDFYLDNKEDFEVFDSNFVRRNKLVRSRFPGLTKDNLYYLFWRNFEKEGRFSYLIKLASEERPEIKQYSDPKRVFELDGTRCMINIFDFYLRNRELLQTFNPSYISTDNLFRTKFGNLPKNIFDRFTRNFGKNEGFNHLIELLSHERPNIKVYTDQRALFSRIPRSLLRG